MNRQTLRGKWRELRGGFRRRWGKLTRDDVATIQGHLDQIAGLIQQRYGYTREEAERELESYLNETTDRIAEYGRRGRDFGRQLDNARRTVENRVQQAVGEKSGRAEKTLERVEEGGGRNVWMGLAAGFALFGVMVYLFNQFGPEQLSHEQTGIEQPGSEL